MPLLSCCLQLLSFAISVDGGRCKLAQAIYVTIHVETPISVPIVGRVKAGQQRSGARTIKEAPLFWEPSLFVLTTIGAISGLLFLLLLLSFLLGELLVSDTLSRTGVQVGHISCVSRYQHALQQTTALIGLFLLRFGAWLGKPTCKPSYELRGQRQSTSGNSTGCCIFRSLRDNIPLCGIRHTDSCWRSYMAYARTNQSSQQATDTCT